MNVGRSPKVAAVAFAADRGPHVLNRERMGERLGDRLERAGQEHDGVAAPQVTLKSLHDRGIEPRENLFGDEACGQRAHACGVELVEIGLVLLAGPAAIDRQVAQPKQYVRNYLARALVAALEQVAPEPPFRAAFDERSVDVEDCQRHCRLPGLPKISLFCAWTNSAMTGTPRTTHSTTDRYTKK